MLSGCSSAKLRTGGVVPEAFPKSLDIIRFVRTCAAANVPFKATAGLHHPNIASVFDYGELVEDGDGGQGRAGEGQELR